MIRDLFYLFYYCWKGKGKRKRTQQAGNRTKRGLASFSSFYFFPILYLEAGHASSCFFPLSGRVRVARVVDWSGDWMICPCTFTIAILNWTELRVILEVKKREGVCSARMDHVLSLGGLYALTRAFFREAK